MKNLGRIILVILVVAAIGAAVWYFTVGRPVDLVARSGGTDGGLQWAYALALPAARAALAPDALLVEAGLTGCCRMAGWRPTPASGGCRSAASAPTGGWWRW